MPMHPNARGPPQLRNCSLGALYATAPSAPIERPVARAASATVAAADA